MITEILSTFLLAMTPIGELRAAIPIALTTYNLHWFWAYIIAVLGNLVPAVLILFFLQWLSEFLSQRFLCCQRFFVWLFNKTKQKHAKKVEKYGPLALTLFTAIPLPVTGAWTASLIAFVFNIKARKALPFIALGVIIAGVIVLILSYFGIFIYYYV